MSTHPGTYSADSGTTVIGGGIRVNGRIAGSEDLHVEGRVEGQIELTETLHVAQQGVVVAQIKARDIVVSGVIVGNVTAEDSVTLNPGSKLVGDITSPRLIIADGAAFSGNVKMSGDGVPVRRARQTSRPRPTTTSAPHTAGRSSTRRASETTAPNVRGSSEAPPNLRRVAAIPPPEVSHAEDEATVVVRHAAIEQGGTKAAEKKAASSKKKAKKSPPRARVPKPGKRRVARRGGS